MTQTLERTPTPTSAVEQPPRRHRVVVVGGGFAGLQAVRRLRRAPVDVTLIDRQNYTLFQPLVYQVATGGLSPAEIAAPLRSVLRRQDNAKVVLGDVVGFDLDTKEVVLDQLADFELGGRIPFDSLIVAGGSQYSYFGHDEWQADAPELKSLTGALDIRSRILTAFEAAEVESDSKARRRLLTFIVVGAGPTGVEMAGQIAELAHFTLRRDFRVADMREARVLLVQAGDRVLEQFPESLSRKATRALEKLGVTPLVGHSVVSVEPEAVDIRAPDGEVGHVEARTVIWAAGVTASALAGALADAAGLDVDRAGGVTVRPDLSLPGHPEVMALGDMVRVEASDGTPQALPGLAPVAIQQGRYAAKAIRTRLSGREPRPFRYVDKGNLATIGRSKAVADIHGLHLSGWIAWAAWLLVHLYYLVGFENRVLVTIRWTVSFLTRRRGARLIVTRR
jgi:NADH dehydrogenase